MTIFLLEALSRGFFLYQRYVARVSHREVHGLDDLAWAYEGFWRKRHRLILAFQHPSTIEPALWPAVLLKELRERLGRPTPLPFAHLVYDHRIPFWAGSYLSWLLPAVGAIPIRRGTVDRAGITQIRRCLMGGRWPLMFAPEGGRTWRQGRWAQLEEGLGTFALWAFQEGRRSTPPRDVVVLPLRVFYHWPRRFDDLWEEHWSSLADRLGVTCRGERSERLWALLVALARRGGFDRPMEDRAAWRLGFAQHLLDNGDLQDEGNFLRTLRTREARLYEPYRKILPEGVRRQVRRLQAAELVWYLDYPWQNGDWARDDEAWEALENLSTLAQLLGEPEEKFPPLPDVPKFADMRVGKPILVSWCANPLRKEILIPWLNRAVQSDGRDVGTVL